MPSLSEKELRRQSAPADLNLKPNKSLPSSSTSNSTSDEEIPSVSSIKPKQASIQVYCRFRPANDDIFKGKNASSAHHNEGSCLFAIDTKSNTIKTLESLEGSIFDTTGPKTFHFDQVFNDVSTQKDIYNSLEHIVTGVIEGFNGTILSYGQTSSGKTHTMEGKIDYNAAIKKAELEEEEIDTEAEESEPEMGIAPRAIKTLFRLIADADETMEFTLKLSFVEIYCEKIRDLLNVDNVNLKIKETPTGELMIQGVTELYVTGEADVYSAMLQGKGNRATAFTQMNSESSRSHSLLMVTIVQNDSVTKKVISGRLVLGDLAGSERVKKTQVKGTAMEEAKNINRSLTTLGMVINALADGLSHVPYRDSKLTRVLQESLGGNSRTALMINAAPERCHTPETVSTLRFGERASRVKNLVVKNEELSIPELKKLVEKANAEIARLVKIIAKMEIKFTGGIKSDGGTIITAAKDGTDINNIITDEALSEILRSEVDVMGIGGDDSDNFLNDSNDQFDELEKYEAQAKQLKAWVKRQHEQLIIKDALVKELDNTIASFGVTKTEVNVNVEGEVYDSDSDNDTVATFNDDENTENASALKKKLGNVGDELLAEKEAHMQTAAQCQALSDALSAMALEHVQNKNTIAIEAVPPSPPNSNRNANASVTDADAEYRQAEVDHLKRMLNEKGLKEESGSQAQEEVVELKDLVAQLNLAISEKDAAFALNASEQEGRVKELEEAAVRLKKWNDTVIQNEKRSLIGREKAIQDLKDLLLEKNENIKVLTKERDVIAKDSAAASKESAAVLKAAEHKPIDVQEMASSLPVEMLNNVKILTGELQSMIDEEVESLENELQESEMREMKVQEELEMTKKELEESKRSEADSMNQFVTQQLSQQDEYSRTERGLRSELSELRTEHAQFKKKIDYLNDREKRALESVEKRRSNRGNFWSPSKLLADDKSGKTGGSSLEISASDELEDKVLELNNTIDAHALVLETKEEVMRSLLKQNATLTMARSSWQREKEQLTARVADLSLAHSLLTNSNTNNTSYQTIGGGKGGGTGGAAGGGTIRGGGFRRQSSANASLAHF